MSDIRPVTDAGKRLLASAWALGEGEPSMLDTILAIEIEMVNRMNVATAAMHRPDASIVWIRSLTMRAPGSLVYHAIARRRRYDKTECGLKLYRVDRQGEPTEHWTYHLTPCRRDTADRIGRPCERCRW